MGGRGRRGPGGAVQDFTDYEGYIPRAPRDENLYYVATNGAVRMFGQQAHSVAVPGQAGTGQVPLSKIAISTDGHYLAGIAGSGTDGLHREPGRRRAPARPGFGGQPAQQAHRHRVLGAQLGQRG